MCLLFQNRDTHDIDAKITRNDKLAELLLEVTKELKLEYDWLECSIIDYIPDELDWEDEVNEFREFKNLKIKAISPRCLLAMKCCSARTQTDKDIEDIRYLMNYLRIRSLEQVDDIINEYYRGEIGCIYQYIVINILNESL